MQSVLLVILYPIMNLTTMYLFAKTVHFDKLKYTSILIKEKIMDSLDFVKSLKVANEPLFKASEMQVEAYFASNPSKEKLVNHFIGRMVNERMNLSLIHI